MNGEVLTTGARMRQGLLGWGCVGLVYFSTGLMTGPALVLPETAIDRAIGYRPGAIWLYLSFFILIPYTYLCAPAGRVRWLARSMQLCALVAGLFFVLLPTTMAYPPVVAGEGAAAALRALLLAGDTSRNCLPSLHGSLTLLCVWALLGRGRPWRSLLALVLGGAIAWSVIALRRHLWVDLSAGIASGIACGALAAWTLRREEDRA
jgi:hypothetical protein